MEHRQGNLFTGRLYYVASVADPPRQQTLASCKGISFEGCFRSAPHWETYSLRSERPLLREADLGVPPPFRYGLVSRASHRELLLAAHHRAVIHHMETDLIPRSALRPGVFPMAVKIDDLVKHLILSSSNYAPTFVHARVPAFGDAIRVASFYGEDLGGAPFFRENITQLTCYTCGLKEIGQGSEILRIASDGSVTFYHSGPGKLRQIDRVIDYLSGNEFFIEPPDALSRGGHERD